MQKLDEFEKELLESIENEEWQSRGDINERKRELQSYIKSQKKRKLSIEIDESDLVKLQEKASKNSSSYENIIQTLIHQYLIGKIEVDF